MKEISKLSEVRNDLFEREENISEAIDFIEKAQAVLSAIGRTLFEDEEADPMEVALHYVDARQLYYVAKDNLDSAINLLA